MYPDCTMFSPDRSAIPTTEASIDLRRFARVVDDAHRVLQHIDNPDERERVVRVRAWALAEMKLVCTWHNLAIDVRRGNMTTLMLDASDRETGR